MRHSNEQDELERQMSEAGERWLEAKAAGESTQKVEDKHRAAAERLEQLLKESPNGN